MKVGIIIGSARDGRNGAKVGKWVESLAVKQEGWEVTMLDLAEVNLPFYSDAKLPGMMGGVYPNAAAQKWSALVAEQDAFLILTPEYNHGMPAVLKNAFDSLYSEWSDKPAGIVSYSGTTGGGIRAGEQVRQVVAHLGMATVQQTTAIDHAGTVITEAGTTEVEALEKNLTREMGQLEAWGKALAMVREARSVTA